jgi:membrane fusion protein (multidrug efflux system)
LNLERAQTLFKQGSAAADELDRARTAYASARESSINAAQNLTLLQQGSRKEDIDAAKADVALAQSRIGEATAAIASSRSDLARCFVKAPFDGWVVRRWLDPGSMPLIAQPVVSLFDPATLRVDANIEEKYLGEVAVGDTADITVDAFPGLHLEGRVTEILRATNSQFSLMPAEGVSGTFIKVTQRVPLRLAVTAPPNLTVGPGLSVDVKIRVGSAPAAKPQ